MCICAYIPVVFVQSSVGALEMQFGFFLHMFAYTSVCISINIHTYVRTNLDSIS